MKVSIVILSWNTKELLEKCLKSIPFSVEIIVVDNASNDGTLHFLDSLKWPNLKVIKNNINLGFAKGNNLGIKEAGGELIMILNSDTIVQKGAIDKLVKFYSEKKDQNMACSPLLLSKKGSLQQEYYMRFPNLWQIFGYHHPLFRFLIMKTPLKWLIVSHIDEEPRQIDQLPGTALMAPKEIWQKVGLLDEDYQFLYEDVDWCWRAKQKGIKLFVVPQAKITHLGGGSWKKRLRTDSFDFYRQFFLSMLFFVQKNYRKTSFKKFKIALVINFLLQFKFKLANYFLNQTRDIRQEELWN